MKKILFFLVAGSIILLGCMENTFANTDDSGGGSDRSCFDSTSYGDFGACIPTSYGNWNNKQRLVTARKTQTVIITSSCSTWLNYNYQDCSYVESDSVAPTGAISYSPTNWVNGNVTVSVACSDNLSGCKQTSYTKVVTQNESGIITIEDNAGNTKDIPYSVGNIDKVSPSINGVTCTGIDSNNNASGAVTCNVSLGNLGPSVDTLSYTHSTQDGVLPAIGNGTTQSYVYTNNGSYSVSAKGEDEAHNLVQGQNKSFKIDTSNPAISTNFNFNIWYNSSHLSDIVFSIKDQVSSSSNNEETGLKSLEIKVNGNTVTNSGFSPTNGISPINVTLSKSTLLGKIQEKADNIITVKAVDKIGHIQNVTYLLDYDNTVPALSFIDTNSSWRNVNVSEPYVSKSDSISGIQTLRYAIGNDLNTDCSDGTTDTPVIADVDGIYKVYVCAKDHAGNISRSNQTYKIDKTASLVSQNGSRNVWFTGSVNISLSTSDPYQSDVTKSSQLKYSKYSWDSPCSETAGTSFTDGQSFTYSVEGRHELFVCNGDVAGNTTLRSWKYYLIDKTDPKIDINGIPNSKKAGENNLILNVPVYDDAGKTDTTLLYGRNYYVQYELDLKGPIQAGYSGKVINENSFHVSESGSIQNTKNLSKTYDLTNAGIYVFSIKLTDKSGRIYQTSKNITIYPADISSIESILSQTQSGVIYANNSQSFGYTLVLKDSYKNFIYGKKVLSLEQECDGSAQCKTIKNKDNSDALEEKSSNYTTDASGKINFSLTSYSPGTFSNIFAVEMKDWNDSYSDTTSTLKKYIQNYTQSTFQKPVSGVFSISNDGVDFSHAPQIGIEQYYKIKLKNIGSLGSISAGNLAVQKTNIMQLTSGHFWENFTLGNTNFSSVPSNIGFKAKIGAISNILKAPSISASGVTISYTLAGKPVQYKLDNFGTAGSCDLQTLGVKVEGIIQTEGKASITGQKENFSDLSTSDLRTEIRKNAYTLIRGMNSGDIINNVKYIKGNYSLESNPEGYETLVVENGNLFISSNVDETNFGIIVLKTDGYNVNSDYNTKGNIYIGKDVEKINAMIYSDGTVRSAKSDGQKYTDSELGKKLTFNGNLFTRNTIGGAVKGDSNYILPGGSSTSNESLAEIYDLNYLRKVDLCLPENPYSVLIRYNSQMTRPKGFE